MVEAVNNTKPKTTTFNPYNPTRNTVLGSGVGLIGGGAIGYMTKSLVDGDKLSDKFVKEVQSQFVEQFIPSPFGKKLIKDFVNLKEELNFLDIKNFLKRNRTVVEATFGETVEDIVGYPPKAMYYFGELKSDFNENTKQLLDRLPNMVDSMFDVDKKKIVIANKETPLAKSIISAERKIKGAQGFKWGAIGGLVVGSVAFVLSKFAPKKQS